eukprot:jgi/Antlo1/1427/1394
MTEKITCTLVERDTEVKIETDPEETIMVMKREAVALLEGRATRGGRTIQVAANATYVMKTPLWT